MKRIEWVVTLTTLTALLNACASPTVDDASFGTKKNRTTTAKQDVDSEGSDSHADDDDDDSAAATPPTTAPSTTPTAPAAPPALRLDLKTRRHCSDIGADFSQATVVDAQTLSLVDPTDGKVVTTLEGDAFKSFRESVALGDGNVAIPLDPQKLPTTPTELVMIAHGDGRFGSPAACGASLKPSSDEERAVKHFPTGRLVIGARQFGGSGCGIVGYANVWFDAGRKEIIAKPTSQFLLAADNEGRSSFPRGDYYQGCDNHSSPLVLDLEGRGVSLGPTASGVFDINGDGTRDTIAWVTSDATPFLVRDANGNGIVDGGHELFGNFTRDPAGPRKTASPNGFMALAGFDDDGDGVIDRHDRVFSQLQLWFDRNHDGVTDPGELESLEARGVTSISLDYIDVSERLETSSGRLGGSIRQRGGATMQDGRVVAVVDVWFERR